ncbi:hypothetical protein KC366_g22 [Hortaea werneckii]|nr:hypothetical protein KC366_g22 [Hortaea werneckii]
MGERRVNRLVRKRPSGVVDHVCGNALDIGLIGRAAVTCADGTVGVLIDVAAVRLCAQELVGKVTIGRHVDRHTPHGVVVGAHRNGIALIKLAKRQGAADEYDVLSVECASIHPEGDLSLAHWLEVLREARDLTWRAKTNWWWTRGVAHGLCFRFGVGAGIVAEVCGFIHVDPERINVDTSVCVEERSELAVPVILRARVEPIWEDCNARPDNTLIQSSIITLEENVLLYTFEVSVIVVVSDSWVHHDNVVLLSLMQRRNQLLHHVQRVPVRIQGEDTAKVHVVDTSRASHEVQVNDTTDGVVLQVLSISIIDFHIHTIRVQQEHAMDSSRWGCCRHLCSRMCLGLEGKEVRRRKYCDSKTKLAAEVSKRTSSLDLRTTEKLKGFST